MVTRSQARSVQISSKPVLTKAKEKPRNTAVVTIKKVPKPAPNGPKTEETGQKKALSKNRKPTKSEQSKENKSKVLEKTEPKVPPRRRKGPKLEEKQDDGVERKTTRTPRERRKSSTVEDVDDKQVKIVKDSTTPVMSSLEISHSEENDLNTTNDKTPNKVEPPVYISPFVTVSRGKNSARKEYEARKSRKSFSLNSSISDHTSPKAGAAYFTWRLDNQINRLQELCDQWNKYKEEESPPEEAISMIDVAIGQTNLLITKKFVQFRGLIERCKNQDSETPVTCEDLHGFWDMMYIQIVNLDKRFENLDKLKANKWEEIMPEMKKEPTKRKGRPVKVAKASAGLMEAIKAARRKKQNENSEISEVKEDRKTPRRISSRLDIVTSSVKHRNSSPGLMMMKIAQYAKGVETPMKSILKSDKKSIVSQSKSVLFHDEAIQDAGNVENDLNLSNSQIQGKSPSRRSLRLSKMKLF